MLAQGPVLPRVCSLGQQKQHPWELVRNVGSQAPPSPPESKTQGWARHLEEPPPRCSDADIGLALSPVPGTSKLQARPCASQAGIDADVRGSVCPS